MPARRLKIIRFPRGPTSSPTMVRLWFSPASKSTAWRLSLGFAVAALLVRCGFIWATRHSFQLYGDPVDFDLCGWSMASGHGYCTSPLAALGTPSAFRPPGYPFVLAVVYAVVGHHVLAARLVGAVLGGVSVGIVVLLAWQLVPRVDFLLLAGALVTVLPSLVSTSTALLSESVFIPIVLLTTLLMLRAERQPAGVGLALSMGALCGAAMLVRTVGALLLLAALAAAIRSVQRRPARLGRTVAVLVGFAVVIAPWVIRDAVVLHQFVPVTTQGGYTMVTTYNTENVAADTPQAAREPNTLPQFAPLLRRPGISETEIASREQAEALSVITAHPLFVLRATLSHLTGEFSLTNATGHEQASNAEMGIPATLAPILPPITKLLTAVALLGGLLALIRRRLVPWPVIVVPALLLLGVAPLLDAPRYRVAIDPFLCLAAAGAARQLASLWRPKALLRSLRTTTSSLALCARTQFRFGFGNR
jgi:4-amino-4-deoxy-L-arabinose transferase-like glycosyltransferase